VGAEASFAGFFAALNLTKINGNIGITPNGPENKLPEAPASLFLFLLVPFMKKEKAEKEVAVEED
jgi:hypothetical protein